ncbi:FAD binding domain-containing protein [Colletotrichum orchidophilum]|uniref:FAD binding domain-containing protein n=1 Tax=Colletotrichum orchidophilum TaxID=1209926 RepID=A0A1G4BF86_9PEZI|nr:FAD binding domain-containing protein [Colletotrichum orchidophilum]OHF00082.1 FAD binding domain-containing protein [Colletotrichum orchidophilum]
MESRSPLKVVIIGAGIGGLMAACALRETGQDVDVYEQSQMANEKGAAIALQPNSTTLLRRYGFEPEKFGATTMENVSPKASPAQEMDADRVWFCSKMMMMDGASLDVMQEITDKVKEATLSEQRAQKCYFIHRVDLHSTLKKRATELGAVLHAGCEIKSVDEDANTITLADGTTVKADVIIGADGVHSRTRKVVFGESYQEHPSALSCFRFLIPTKSLREDPETRVFVEKPGSMMDLVGPDRRIILYPCSQGEYLNVLPIVPRQLAEAAGPKKENLLSAFSIFASPVQRMLEKTDEQSITMWPLFDMSALPIWAKNSVALLGDAAHPFTPFLAQGAASAMEDAVSLAVMLPLGTKTGQVPGRLQLYERCRKARVDRIQELSRVRGRDASGERGKPPTGNEIFSFAMYCKQHDEYVHSSKFLEAFDVPFIPAPPSPMSNP